MDHTQWPHALKMAKGSDRNYSLHACVSASSEVTVVQCEMWVAVVVCSDPDISPLRLYVKILIRAPTEIAWL